MNISIIGSTGFLGQQALDVLRHQRKGFYKVFALACQKNYPLLLKQAEEVSPRFLVLYSEEAYHLVRQKKLPSGIAIGYGLDGIMEICAHPEVDMVFFLAQGTELLAPLLLAIERKKKICLASKEMVVAFGKFIFQQARKYGTEIIPADSEICALHSMLANHKREAIKRVIITSSGGPLFRSKRKPTIKNVLGHPVWRMGKKITVDSATLMNKGFEVIEAVRFFSLPPEKIEVLIHPQVIIHSLIEFIDGTLISQMAPPDMRVFLQYALTYPKKESGNILPLRLETLPPLELFPVPKKRFPCLSFAYEAIKRDGSLPTVLVAADEVAVDYFLRGEIDFSKIPKIIGKTLSHYRNTKDPTLAQLKAIERQAKELAKGYAEEGCQKRR